MLDYIDELNESQRDAVLYNDGPSLVIAGAGSGKTRVLTYKIAYLLEHGYEPWHILALTFTNKAAREMKARIARLVGEERARHLWMGTFHSMFLRILHAEAATLGFTTRFTIYDAADSKSLVRAILKELNLDEKMYKPSLVLTRISNAKNRLITSAEYTKSAETYEADHSENMPAMREIYTRYCARCRQADAMDFDDLLLNTYLLFRDHPEVLERYRARFRYILVDEYQDTNFAQHAIVKQLSSQHMHVCVVGDDAQSIYSFRGANIDNILYFTKLYPDTKLFKLEQNYRSTQTIVRAANSLIAKNKRQIPKEVFSENAEGEPIPVLEAYSDIEEGEIVANKILSLKRIDGCEYADFSVLYRTNAQSRIFEETLRKHAIPYRIYGGLSFYQRKEIKDVIAYFRLVTNPNDEEAFKRIINYPARGIGETTLNKITHAAAAAGASLWKVLSEPISFGLQLSKGTLTKLQGFRTLIEGFIARRNDESAFRLGVSMIRESGIAADVSRDNSPENLSRKENIDELANGLADFCGRREEEGITEVGIADFLSEVSLLSDQDTDDSTDDNKVTLMTVHSAKGLEFRNVFVVGMEEELFPSSMAGDSRSALEEERRLFYVAITRAEERCFLSYAKSRFRYGKTEMGRPSRFLQDIDSSFLQLSGRYGLSPRPGKAYGGVKSHPYSQPITPPASARKLKPLGTTIRQPIDTPTTSASAPLVGATSAHPSAKGLTVGRHIIHERFGAGEVIKIEGAGDNVKATIHFENAGEKQLLLRFARFKVVEE